MKDEATPAARWGVLEDAVERRSTATLLARIKIIDDDEGFEVPRQSLLDVVLEKKQKKGKIEIIDRVVIVGRALETQESDEEIRSYFLDLFELIAEDERW